MDSAKIDQSGHTVLFRVEREHGMMNGEKFTRYFLETTTLELRPAAIAKVLAAVEECGILRLQREYHKIGYADGTQWKLLIQQEGHEKDVYFNNAFPRSIQRFAEELYRILLAESAADLEWKRVP